MAAQRQQTVLRGTPAELLAALTRTAAHDTGIEQEHKKTEKLGCGLWAGCGVFGFIAFATMIAAGPFAILPALAAIGFLVPAIIISLKAQKLKAQDLDNDRITLAFELIQALEPDLSEKVPTELTLRHGPAVQWGKLLSREKVQGGLLAYEVWQSQHEDEWFSMAARLQDGAAMKMTITQTAKRKSKQKRKYTKYSDQVDEEISMVLRLPVDRYPHLDRLQQLLDPQVLNAHERLTVRRMQALTPMVRVSAITGRVRSVIGRGGTVARSGEIHSVTANDLLGMMAWVYAGLGGCTPEPTGKPRKNAAPGAAATPAAADVPPQTVDDFAGMSGTPGAPPAT